MIFNVLDIFIYLCRLFFDNFCRFKHLSFFDIHNFPEQQIVNVICTYSYIMNI